MKGPKVLFIQVFSRSRKEEYRRITRCLHIYLDYGNFQRILLLVGYFCCIAQHSCHESFTSSSCVCKISKISLTWDHPWSKIVWFKGCIPKHAFNFWVAFLNRLPVRDRLIRWGLEVSDRSVLRAQRLTISFCRVLTVEKCGILYQDDWVLASSLVTGMHL